MTDLLQAADQHPLPEAHRGGFKLGRLASNLQSNEASTRQQGIDRLGEGGEITVLQQATGGKTQQLLAACSHIRR